MENTKPTQVDTSELNHEIDLAIVDMTNDFLKWKLPESVESDGCVTRQGKGRFGTNLLTMPQALMLMQEVVRPRLQELIADTSKQNEEPRRLGGKLAHYVKAARAGDSPLIQATLVKSIDEALKAWDDYLQNETSPSAPL